MGQDQHKEGLIIASNGAKARELLILLLIAMLGSVGKEAIAKTGGVFALKHVIGQSNIVKTWRQGEARFDRLSPDSVCYLFFVPSGELPTSGECHLGGHGGEIEGVGGVIVMKKKRRAVNLNDAKAWLASAEGEILRAELKCT